MEVFQSTKLLFPCFTVAILASSFHAIHDYSCDGKGGYNFGFRTLQLQRLSQCNYIYMYNTVSKF